jgi:hypothetical protein
MTIVVVFFASKPLKKVMEVFVVLLFSNIENKAMATN